jgi:hypothetical protein
MYVTYFIVLFIVDQQDRMHTFAKTKEKQTSKTRGLHEEQSASDVSSLDFSQVIMIRLCACVCDCVCNCVCATVSDCVHVCATVCVTVCVCDCQ